MAGLPRLMLVVLWVARGRRFGLVAWWVRGSLAGCGLAMAQPLGLLVGRARVWGWRLLWPAPPA